MRATTLACLVPLALTAGCGAAELPAPELWQACQARFHDTCVDWLHAGESVPVRVLGQGLVEILDVDLGAPEGVTFDEAFELALGGVALRRVTLLPDSRTGVGTLFGVVPASLPAGRHDLWVRTPAGLEAELEGALEVRSPLRVRAGLDPASLPAGARASLTVEVEGLGLGSLEALALEVSAEPQGLVAPGASPPPFALGPEAARTLRLQLTGLAPGLAQLRVRVSGRTAGGIPVEAEAARRPTLEIR